VLDDRERARLLGLAVPERQPPATALAYQLAMREAVRRAAHATMEAVGAETMHRIRRDLDVVGMQLPDDWEYHEVTFLRRGGEPRFHLRVVLSTPGEISVVSMIEAEGPHDWEDEHQPYRLELFGRRIRSRALFDQSKAADVQWAMHLNEDGSEGHAMAAMRARAVHPDAGVYALAEWRPGWPGPEFSYGGVIPGRKNDTKAADVGFHLLAEFRNRVGRPGTTDDEALAEAVRQGREWLDDHPGATPADFKRADLAARLCIQTKSLDEWMRRKHLTLKMVRDRLR
jgi:hypothetical protein